MQKVSKENSNHCVSGGFIFDQMDRFAHDYLKKEQNIKGYLFTECAHIHYSKQICDFGNVKIVPHETCYVGSAIGESWAKWFAENGEFQCLKKYSAIDPEKAITMTARQYASWNGNFILETLNKYIVPFDKTLQILEKEVEKGKVGFFRKDSQANRVYFIHDKAVCLCGDAGGGAAKMGQYLFGCLTPDRVEKRQNGQRFNDGQKFYTLTAQDQHGVLLEGYIRKLTPIECERLQTMPDNYTAGVSDTQRYKMLGNGWTVDVIAHLLKGLK